MIKSNTAELTKLWVQYLGYISVLLFTASIFWVRDFNRIIEILLALSIILSSREIYNYHKSKKAIWLYALMAICMGYMALSNQLALNTYPDTDLNHDRFSRHYIRCFLFLFIGWWVIKKPIIAWYIIACFCLAMCIKIIGSSDFWDIQSLKKMRRLSFGFSNQQHTGAYAGTLLIALLSLSSKIKGISNRHIKLFTILIALAIGFLAFFTSFYSQTRAVWLGLSIAFGIAFTPWILPLIKNKPDQYKTKILLSYISILVIVIFAASQTKTISLKIDKTIHVISTLLETKEIRSAGSSTTARLNQWVFALKLIKEKPFSGYGGATKEYLIKISDMPIFATKSFGHFHNSYLELAVAYGLGATLVFIFLLLFLLKKIITSYKKGSISPEFAFFGISWIIFFAIINIFESYLIYRTGYFLFSIFGGILYGLSSGNLNKTESKNSTP